MKNKAMEEMKPRVLARFGEAAGEKILARAEAELLELCRAHSGDPKPVKAHREGDIFPCISLYRAMQAEGIQKEKALAFLDESWSSRAKAGAEKNRKLLRLFGLYKLYPAMFRSVAKKQFGTAAGFEAKFYDTEKTRCKFDMTKCLFLDTCRDCGCPELTVCFCHTDDINNEGLHPRLRWNRTRYMGGGGDLCDFDIYVTEKK